MDNQTRNFLSALGCELGKQMGQLYTINIVQTSALLDLASALKNERDLSLENRKVADKALKTIDRLIGMLDEALSDIDRNTFDVQSYLGPAAPEPHR